MNIIVIGAGLSGLTAAVTAQKNGHSVTVLEKSTHIGGVIRSERHQGFLLEFGPNTVQLKPELYDLIRELGLASTLQIADAKTPRYVLFNDQLRKVPTSVPSLIGTDLLSLRAKLRLLIEPFIRSKGSDEETLMNFANRRFGPQTAERLVAPFVSGIWAGNAEMLSAVAAFPKLAEWERTAGSVIKGMITSVKPKHKVPRGLISFQGGMQTLVHSLREQLPGSIKTGVAVQSLQKTGDQWTVTAADGQTWTASKIILALPAEPAAALVSSFAPEAATALKSIPYESVAILHLAFDKSHIGHKIKGFGFLSPPSEKSNILGCLWTSNLFPDRAPSGNALWTVFMGGATNRPILQLNDDQLIERALESLKIIMKVSGEPVFRRVTRVSHALPQYTVGHLDRVRTLNLAEKNHAGLVFVGNYREGIAVGDVVKSATAMI